MDELDLKIVGILQQDGRASNARIARQLGVSEGTVRRRLKRLMDEEAIQVLALPEPTKLGYTTEAIVALQVDPGKIEDVAAELAGAPEALNVSVTTGAFDLFAWVALPSPEELHNFLPDYGWENTGGQAQRDLCNHVREETNLHAALLMPGLPMASAASSPRLPCPMPPGSLGVGLRWPPSKDSNLNRSAVMRTWPLPIPVSTCDRTTPEAGVGSAALRLSGTAFPC